MPKPEAPYTDDAIKVVDITDDLKKHHSKKYRRTKARPINRVILHHTAGGVTPGLRGPESTAEWCVNGRGWPGMPYHVYVPYTPMIDGDGRMIVWQTQDFDVRSYHTGGGQNKHGIGVVCQGLFVSPYCLKTLKRQPTPDPSEAQKTAIRHVWTWLSGLYGLSPDPSLSCHAWHGKPACPGRWLEDWVRRMRG